MRCRLHALRFGLLLFVAVLAAQEYRATVVGTVTDPSGAAVPGASVVVTASASGIVSRTLTNGEGAYQVPYLLPGVYSIEISRPGFKTHRRGPIELHVDDRAVLDVALEVGRSTEQVTVTAEAPVLEEGNGAIGQVVGQEQINSLPLDGHNPFTLMNLGAGVSYTGSLLYSRPFDNGAIADYSINGGVSGTNEFQIDGVSNNANTGRSNLAYVPPAEATQEFRVQSSVYDAQVGRTAGGVVNVSIKPGTNRLHGALYEYLRRTDLNANLFSSNANGQPRAPRNIDQYGGEIDGPVRLPHLYNGKDRTFFMFSMEQYREITPQPVLGSVPTPEQRAGDFSQTYTAAGKLYTIYDPLVQSLNPAYDPNKPTSVNNFRYVRQPFPGNRIPSNRFEPIALNVLKDIPLPNQPGDPVTKLNDWFGANAGETTHFRNLIARVDHLLNQSWKMFGRWNHNYRDGGVIDYNDWGTRATRKIHAGRRNDGTVIDVVGTVVPTAIFTARAGYNRFKQLSMYDPIDISALGLPKSFVGQLQIPDTYPQFTFENYLQTGISQWDIIPSETYSAQAGMNHSLGKHSLKYGFEFRLMHYANFGRSNASGTFAFTRGYTSITPDVSDPASGNAIASFLLGTMNAASATINATPYNSWKYPVGYVQEDWRITRTLTLNVGLRWDYESPVTERYNRQTRGFDFNSPSPTPANGIVVRGGLLFAGVNGVPRGEYKQDWDNFQPRFGYAWRPFGSKLVVLRGGFGRSYLPTTDIGGATGFSQTTNAETSTVEGLALRVLSNPFPSGLTRPPGASRGLATQAGDNIAFNDPGRSLPYVWQYSTGFQYQIFRGTVLEATYSGSQTRSLMVNKSNINVLSVDQLALGTLYLNQSTPNPFYGVLPASTPRGTSANVQRRVLLYPYPQFNSIAENNMSVGSAWYNSLQLRIERRFKDGIYGLVTYTNSKNMTMISFLNNQDTRLSRELASYDIPQRLVFTGILDLPFGRNRKWLNHGLASKVVGGWRLSANGTAQSGPPVALPDYYIYGNPQLPASQQTLSRWFDTSPTIWVQRPSDTLRTAKLYSPNIRRFTAPQASAVVMRDFRVTERQKLTLRASAFNLTNTPIFGSPNNNPASPLFGVVPITQINLPRSLELGFRYGF
ncbi:MAG TPA: carboxypeptidase-like regulatory domain-containing protein [Bryobacteraceae bacterium]|nr:carboxypeptidase-like regulatory domain-containing protein [Bryobacteraceae bacterium]